MNISKYARWASTICLVWIIQTSSWSSRPASAQPFEPTADQPTESPAQQRPGGFGGPDAVPNRIESDSLRQGALFRLELLKPYREWKERIREEYGYTFGAAYIPVYLRASDSLSDADDHAASGVFRFSGTWELLGRGTANTGSLIYLGEHRHRYTDNTPAGFAFESLGSVGAISIPFADDGWHLTNLYWSQSWDDGRVEAVGGFLDVTDFVDVYPLTSPWTDFFNFTFSIGAATMDLPDDGALGLAAGTWLTDRLYVIAGFEDLNSDPNDPLDGFDTVSNDREFFKHVEIGWTTSPWSEYYLDNLHLTAWHSDERNQSRVEDGWGAFLSYTRTVFDEWMLFARGGFSEDGGSLLKRSVSIGGGFTPGGMQMLGAGSQLGFGVNWGQPNDTVFGSGLDDQYTVEAYYRLQLTGELAITPDVQLLINPALNPEDDATWVFGLRGRLAF